MLRYIPAAAPVAVKSAKPTFTQVQAHGSFEFEDEEEDTSDHEPIPTPDDFIECLLLDVKRDEDWEEHPKKLPMNLPLGEIIGTYDPKEVARLARMVVAYDN